MYRPALLPPCLLAFALVALPGLVSAAQNSPAPAGFPVAYPKRETDPAAVERGKTIYVARGCSFCHGVDARGGNGGPSLLRAQKVLQDQKGELISEPITKGVAGTAMVGFPLSQNEIADVAEFLHSFDVAGYDSTRLKPAVFEMGSARAGKKYFDKVCAACHSIDGDLQGLATKFQQPIDLQQGWLMPRNTADAQVTVTFANGNTLGGSLVRIDEFLVTLKLADGSQRTVSRDGDAPMVSVKDPLEPHRSLLSTYRDQDIHNVTAYLVTLK